MSFIRGFPPLAGNKATCLILGSMPGRESLRLQQYYAHPRNAFWPVMTELFDLEEQDYSARAEELQHHGVAVWDVLQACFRTSSLDSDIDNQTLTTNDFATFYYENPTIRRVYFNGAKAESVYLRHVLPSLSGEAANHTLLRLPSTSPAHASMTFTQKLDAWQAILA